MEFIILDTETATEEQLTATIECNNRTASLMTSEIEKLKKVAEIAKKSSKPVPTETPQLTPQDKPKVFDKDFEDEVEYYNSQLKELNLSNIEDEIQSVLPSRKHYQYERILMRLKLESIRVIKEIKELLIEEGLTPSDVESFKEEIDLEFKKIELIDKYLKPIKEEVVEETKENNLIFVPTPGGNIRVLDEIESIPQDYYEKFNGLFRSIKDGTFKNVRQFDNNSDLAGLCEVKDFKVRVVFVRLDKDSYAVISAFTKKTDNDRAYRGALIKKYTDYQMIEDRLKASLQNEEFMKEQQKYEDELFRIMAPSQKQVPSIKKKGGDKK